MIKNLLNFINSIPFNLTIKHYQTFGEASAYLENHKLDSSYSWDILRLKHAHFSVPVDREEWLKAAETKIKKDGQDGGLLERVRDITALLKREKINSIFSVGVGGAGLEYQIKKSMPDIKLVCSEYAPRNIKLLKKVFIESNEIIFFNVLKGDWNFIKQHYLKDAHSVLLMYRLDASFTDDEWGRIFSTLYNAGIESIIYIPSSFLTLLSLLNRKKREIRWLITRRPISFAGYLRTRKKSQQFWASLYEEKALSFGGLNGFFLKRKSGISDIF